MASRSEAEGLGGKLVQIKPCERYAMDSLTHSIPFLIPQASALLDTIGANFLDSLSCKGLNPNHYYHFIYKKHPADDARCLLVTYHINVDS